MPNTLWIDTRELRVGLYVQLDLGWLEHPFAFSRFKIASEDDIRTLQGLGLEKVRYSPELSDEDVALAVSAQPVPEPRAEVPSAQAKLVSPVMLAKQAMLAKIRQRREAAERVEKAFTATVHSLRTIERQVYSKPTEMREVTTRLVSHIAQSLLSAPEVVIQVIGDKPGGEELYLHSLNVATLAMIVARELALAPDVVNVLGMGALLHDMGKHEIPDRILHKSGPLLPAERHLAEQHPVYGVVMAQRMHLPDAGLAIIADHHELFDGSGYPRHLKGQEVSLLARIVVITNYFDGLCNPPDIHDAMTPHEALSHMFSRMQAKFDPSLLKVFIRCLGVYPPGTVVQLSNGSIGMVSSVNTQRPMKPIVLVHDERVPRDEALMLDLGEEASLNISKAIRPAQVPPEILSYLSPRARVSYFFDCKAPEPAGNAP